MSELTTQLRAAAIELAVSKMIDVPDYDGPVDNALGHVERALELATAPSQSGPGFARFTASDSPADIERKMAVAFAPLRAMRWALHPNYRSRDTRGRFLKREQAR